jgi:hypothetical protein
VQTAVRTLHSGAWSERYWLDHSEGFRVESANGRIGMVDEAVPWMDAIAVRAGLNGSRILLVPFDQVLLIDPLEERIVLRTSPMLLGTLSHRPAGWSEPVPG